MKKYRIVAYADEECNTKQTTLIKAENHAEAQAIAWKLYPEHHEVIVCELRDGE